MEGPTPVSALIHAATMVTAGVFLLVRCSPLIEFSETALVIITVIGAMTAFFAATVGLVQNDIKKVIAYSTCSQLGYMVFACGISNYNVSVFHLANHAFFKALLFLSAGSVIHALADEQDMRKMGGVIKLVPYTYVMMFIGSLSLMGFPFLTGFYSKDAILELAYAKYTISGHFAHWFGCISAFFTAFYSFRLVYFPQHQQFLEFVLSPTVFKVLCGFLPPEIGFLFRMNIELSVLTYVSYDYWYHMTSAMAGITPSDHLRRRTSHRGDTAIYCRPSWTVRWECSYM